MSNKCRNIQCSGKYLSDNIDTYPFASKGEILLFNKGITGCGGTTMVADSTLKDDFMTICLMPTIASVQSKAAQYNDNPCVRCVDGEHKLSSDEFFVFNDVDACFDSLGVSVSNRKNAIKVIFATYDQYYSIFRELKNSYVKMDTVRLVIDECHCITRDDYRKKTMNRLINHWDELYSVTLMTATPDEFIIDALREFYPDMSYNRLDCVWADVKVSANLYHIRKKNDAKKSFLRMFLAKTVKEWSKIHKGTNLYLMYNTVEGVERLIDDCKLKDDEYHFLCSAQNELTVKRSTIDDINNELRPINFLTSAGFEGCDIKDPNGKIMVVIDCRQIHIIHDYQTIIQSFGRCRGSVFQPDILFYGSPSKEMRKGLEDDFKNCKALDKHIKDCRENNIEVPEFLFEKDEICYDNDGNLSVNPLCYATSKRKLCMIDACSSLHVFKANLINNGISVSEKSLTIYEDACEKTMAFKAACKKYEADPNDPALIGYSKKWLIKNAYELLGAERVKDMEYKENLIRRRLKEIDEETSMSDIWEMMAFRNGDFHTCDYIKKRFDIVKGYFGMEFKKIEELISFIPNSSVKPATKDNQRGYYICWLVNENYTKEGNDPDPSQISISIAKYKGLYNSSSFTTDVLANAYKKKPELSSEIFNKLFKGAPMDLTKKRLREKFLAEGFGETEFAKTWDYYQNDIKETKQQQFMMGELNPPAGTSSVFNRKHETFKVGSYTDCLIMDIDDGTTIEEFVEYNERCLGNPHFYLYKTFSYNKLNDKYSFRVIYPLSERLYLMNDDDVRNLAKVKMMLCKFNDPNCRNFYFCPFTEEPMEEYGEKGVNINSDWVEMQLFEKHIEAIMMKLDIKADFHDSRDKVAILTGIRDKKAAVVKDATKGLVERAVRLILDAEKGNRHKIIYGQLWKLITIYHIDNDQISYIRSQIFDYEKIKEFDYSVNYIRKQAA